MISLSDKPSDLTEYMAIEHVRKNPDEVVRFYGEHDGRYIAVMFFMADSGVVEAELWINGDAQRCETILETDGVNESASRIMDDFRGVRFAGRSELHTIDRDQKL